MAVAKVTEISSTSTESFEDALDLGVERAQQTIRNLRSAEERTMYGHVALAFAAFGLTVALAGCDNRSGTTVASPSPRVSPVAAPQPPAAAIPFQIARVAS